MSMPLNTDPPAADAAAPVEPVAPAEAAAPAEAVEAALHPAWEKALEGVPDIFRDQIIKQARESDKEAQAAIEKARAADVPDEWRSFLADAQQAGATPVDLVAAWNNANVIASDPIGFLDTFKAKVDEMVAAGQLTRKEGQEAQQQAQQQAADAIDADPLLTAEQKEIAKLKADLNEIRTGQTAAAKAQQEAQARTQAEADAKSYADAFMGELDGQLPNVSNAAKQYIGRNADSMLANDTTGKLTPKAAITSAIEQAKALGIKLEPEAAAQQAQQQAIPPVGGGSAGLPAAAAPKFEGATAKTDRAAAMLAEAARVAGS